MMKKIPFRFNRNKDKKEVAAPPAAAPAPAPAPVPAKKLVRLSMKKTGFHGLTVLTILK
jgi:hypothetical protein